MSDTDYITIARLPLARIRELPIGQLLEVLERSAPVTRQALDRIFAAR